MVRAVAAPRSKEDSSAAVAPLAVSAGPAAAKSARSNAGAASSIRSVQSASAASALAASAPAAASSRSNASDAMRAIRMGSVAIVQAATWRRSWRRRCMKYRRIASGVDSTPMRLVNMCAYDHSR